MTFLRGYNEVTKRSLGASTMFYYTKAPVWRLGCPTNRLALFQELRRCYLGRAKSQFRQVAVSPKIITFPPKSGYRIMFEGVFADLYGHRS